MCTVLLPPGVKPIASKIYIIFFFCGSATQSGSWPPHSWGFLDHTQRTTFGRTPLDEWSARRRDLYLTTHNTHNRQTFMSAVGFETTISAYNLSWKFLILSELFYRTKSFYIQQVFPHLLQTMHFLNFFSVAFEFTYEFSYIWKFCDRSIAASFLARQFFM